MGSFAHLLAQHGQYRAVRSFITPHILVCPSHDWRYDGSSAMGQHHDVT